MADFYRRVARSVGVAASLAVASSAWAAQEPVDNRVLDVGEVGVRPVPIGGPCLSSSEKLPQPPGQPVLVSIVIDSFGKVDPKSARVGAPEGSELASLVGDIIVRTRFVPARTGDRAVSVRWVGPVYFGASISSDTALSVCIVDQKPERLSGPSVSYPAELQAAKVQGTVVVRCIVDSVGYVDVASIRIISTPNAALVGTTWRIVAGSRYRPGRRRGHPVATVVYQPITYQLTGFR